MISFKEFRERYQESGYGYSQHLDGAPLKPKTIVGAEEQIYELAREIRTTFGLDKRWAMYKNQIVRATSMMDDAAKLLGEGMSGEERSTEHNFNEWLKGRVASESNDPDYREPSFSKILGEDPGDPFSAEVDVEEGHWTVSGPLWAVGYVMNGSEPKAGGPVQEEKGVVFKTPGRRLENLPPALKMAATNWIDKEVEWSIQNYEEEDPRDHEDRDPYNPDPHGDRYWDRYWSTGPGRDPN